MIVWRLSFDSRVDIMVLFSGFGQNNDHRPIVSDNFDS